MTAEEIVVPPALVAAQVRFRGEAGRAWVERVAGVAADYLDRWRLRRDGPTRSGVAGLVLPVITDDGTPAMLKLQDTDWDHPGEGLALRTWAGDGAARLLREDPETWTLLIERLDPDRDLHAVKDDTAAVRVIATLLNRLNAYTAPPEIPRLADRAEKLIADAPLLAARLRDPAEGRLLRRWADQVAEVVGDAGDRLLHWDLHYENVLAGGREPWLAIDPKPLAGDPGFELAPALWNRWDKAAPVRTVRRRFDVMVETMGLDRERAAVWTVGRSLQNSIWSVEDGDVALEPEQVTIAEAVTRRG
ncbi:aminoglycoside phosphotransferase family protein [Asanoa sp. WMMD1127]|uniref:aminoglycoside phosphotransferase family protein n=1 Tax=Asanoa sp. WMMD1127 TaxID=3016107 RepID=UPI002416D50F|nr:aminoglycoside phosphotransferase family protein [Asanoa sp. WMMD1127]MDG4823816.1 aminoglycoside phosphotransferase family protein [Asanoa sp. WMMD1127]